MATTILVAEAATDTSAADVAQARVEATFAAPGFGPADFQAAVTQADIVIQRGRERVRQSPEQWSSHELLARGLMARARLTGDYREWAEAARRIEQAMMLAPAGSGPLVADVTLAFATHRLRAAERSLSVLSRSAVPHDSDMQAGIAGVAGDIAFYRGDMAAAREHYARGESLEPLGSLEFREAVLATAGAQFDDADAAIQRYIATGRRHSPQVLAEAATRLGAHQLAQGRWGVAETWFARANRMFPGHWLSEAHLIQARALRGDPAAARQMAALAERSNSAEVMDAAAMIFRHNGDGANSRLWAARAAALWAERLRLLPSAAYGHAVEHHLAFGDPATALTLARNNVALRPFGEARVLLAAALTLSNQPQAALAEIARAEASGWRSAALYAAKADAAALAGDVDSAQEARAQAERINPNIFDYRTSMIWFSHG